LTPRRLAAAKAALVRSLDGFSLESLILQNDGAASQTGSVKGRSHTLHEPPRPVERINGPGLITTHHGHGVHVVTVNNSEPCGLVPGVNTRPEQTMGIMWPGSSRRVSQPKPINCRPATDGSTRSSTTGVSDGN